MLPYSMIAGGTFAISVTASVAKAVNVEVISQNPPDYILLKAITQWGQNRVSPLEWWWEKSMPQGAAMGLLQGSGALDTPAVTSTFIAAGLGGISTFDTANPPSFAALATTNIAGNTGTFVVTMSNTGSIQVGDYVRLYSTTGELQIAGYSFQVTAVTVNTSITLGYMASANTSGGLANFANAATAGFVKKYIPGKNYPRAMRVAMITKATQAVVYFTRTTDFTVGERVSFRVPSAFGMVEINNVVARVLSVTNSATVASITIDLDTSGFTTFNFPTSAIAAAGVTPAQCVPAGSVVVPISASNTNALQPPGTNLLDAFDNRNTRVIQFGHGLFDHANFIAADGDVYMWQAYKYDLYENSTITI